MPCLLRGQVPPGGGPVCRWPADALAAEYGGTAACPLRPPLSVADPQVVNLPTMTRSSSASLFSSTALSLTLPLPSEIEPEVWLTSEMSCATSPDTVETWATFSVTSWMPSDAWPMFSAISVVVADCSSTAVTMVATISSTSLMTLVICWIWLTVASVEFWMESMRALISPVASAVCLASSLI